MIEDPPILKIRRIFSRPSTGQIDGFSDAQTGHVVDAMDGIGAMNYRIKPLDPAAAGVIGTALTCHCGPGDNLGLFGALDAAQPGDIIVAASDGYTDAAVTGDLMIGVMKNIGVRAFVTDGTVRDLAGIRAVGLPVFCAGLTPNSPVRNGPGTTGFPIIAGGRPVKSGDIIVGDMDGVVVVPRKSIDAVLARLVEIRKAEALLEAEVKAGLKMFDWMRPVLDSDRVVEVSE
jgi:4-hydroxy-4-methyl-2-oxoglutarate aldolase